MAPQRGHLLFSGVPRFVAELTARTTLPDGVLWSPLLDTGSDTPAAPVIAWMRESERMLQHVDAGENLERVRAQALDEIAEIALDSHAHDAISVTRVYTDPR